MKNFITWLCLIFAMSASAQFGGGKDMAKAMKDIKGRVYGKLIDARTRKPVEFASVVVLWSTKDSLLGGALTEENGEFNIENLPPMGSFRFRATQIGYKTYETRIQIQLPNKLEQDLGDIGIDIDEKVLGEVEVTAEKNAVVMSIDKRTYNVDKDISVRGGTAVDVMKNVPGVTVDADGNAQLRNQSPIIFVDGRPTNLTLQQIPSDQIDRVEVITNPSVKYDASATGGILNIILKKNLKPGYNGTVMTYVGTGDRYGGMISLNVKEGKWNFTSMYTYNQSINDVQGYTKRQQLDGHSGTLGFFDQKNRTIQANAFNFGKLGVDYAVNNRNTLSLNGTIMAGRFKTADHQSFYSQNQDRIELQNGTRISDQNAHFQNYNAQLLYKKSYPKAGKELSMDANYSYNTGGNDYLFRTYTFISSGTTSVPDLFQKNLGSSKAQQGVFQLDFTNPISETRKLEMGLKSYYKNSLSANNTSSAQTTENSYVRDSIMSNRYLIDDMINAAYVNYNDKMLWDVSYQAGLRFEQSYYKGTIADKKQSFSYNYPLNASDILKSVFPGIYFSKKINANEFQLNFSRKIQRPNFFQLMPFVMFSDRQNYRIGNPQLKPEFKNIIEFNYNRTLTKGSYLGSVYFRYEEQPITEVAFPSEGDPNVLVYTTVNGSNSIRYGMEHTFKYTLFKNFDATLNANVFYIYIKGLVLATQPPVKAEGFAFNAKANLSYKFPKQLTLQVNTNYDSPRILLLGYTIPVLSMDISLNKMLGSKWILNATLSDVFNARRFGTYYKTPYYVQDVSRRREARFVKFSVTYMFGKMDASIFKRGKQRSTNENQGNQDGLDFGR